MGEPVRQDLRLVIAPGARHTCSHFKYSLEAIVDPRSDLSQDIISTSLYFNRTATSAKYVYIYNIY